MKKYFKVDWSICPKCKGMIEIVLEGDCSNDGRREKQKRIVGAKCYGCGAYKKVDINA